MIRVATGGSLPAAYLSSGTLSGSMFQTVSASAGRINRQ